MPNRYLGFTAILAGVLSLTACSDDDDQRHILIGGSDARIYDTEFVNRRHFFLQVPYIQANGSIYSNELALFVNFNDSEADRRAGRQIVSATATVDGSMSPPELTEEFIRLDPFEDYYLYYSSRSLQPLLVMRYPIGSELTLAASYQLRSNDGTVSQVGTFWEMPHADTFILKMIQPPDRVTEQNRNQGPWAPTKDLEIRNVYDLEVRSILPPLSLTITDDQGRTALDGISYLEILGLDLVNNDTALGLDDTDHGLPGQRGPDGLVDPEFIDYENGTLYFPDLRPFDPDPVDLNGGPGETHPTHPRRKALGYRTVSVPVTAEHPDGVAYERLPAGDAAQETNPAVYDLRNPGPGNSKFVITGSYKSGGMVLR